MLPTGLEWWVQGGGPSPSTVTQQVASSATHLQPDVPGF